jgi:hypothetical protein
MPRRLSAWLALTSTVGPVGGGSTAHGVCAPAIWPPVTKSLASTI